MSMNHHAPQTFARADYKDALIVPVTIGRNRARGRTEGAMVDDDGLPQGPMDNLRAQLVVEAQAAGVDPDANYVSMCVGQILRLYEDSAVRYRGERTDQLGHVYEGNLPSGRVLLMAESALLRRLGLLH